MIVSPITQAIEAGSMAAYSVSLSGTYTGTVTLTDSVPGALDKVWSDTSVTLPRKSPSP
ncbi:MAG: hypothetical protein HC806_01795 [Anaerolineae bacterium]|nr:hypothetical protein [Anaerolineae bacterium]